MDYIKRNLEPALRNTLKRHKSVLLLGARQTGKTTLINYLNPDLSISFIQPAIRLLYEQNPSRLSGEIEALAETQKEKLLVCIDEVQKIPEILDVAQDLIDRKIADFILTGSSARKLRSGNKVNLLPGRVVLFRLDPLIYSEIKNVKPECRIEDFLLYGSLPAIILLKDPSYKETDLASYVVTYLEEEIRSEAIVRNVGLFTRFLNLAASESGNIVNFRKLSQEIGVAHTTIASYYQILEDCLVVERVDPLLKTKIRRKLIKASKYLFFDLGVRRLAADEGIKLPIKHMGFLFEQWVGLELIRLSRLSKERAKVYFWRDAAGPEVDWILEKDDHYIPIEVKWTDKPSIADIKHLELFCQEYSETIAAYVVCRIPRKIKLAKNIYALPWQEVGSLL